MNKTALKIFVCFAAIASVAATIMLCINFLGFAFIGSDTSIRINGKSPQAVIEDAANSLVKTESGYELTDGFALPDDYWCILLNENGDTVWSENNPGDIPESYSICDVARLTKWFLNDYPVYVYTTDFGLLILGIPKNSVGKYDMAYSMEWFDTLPWRIVSVLLLNLMLGIVFSLIFGAGVYKSIQNVTCGINALREEREVRLKQRGLFKEVAKNINETSAIIQRKNAVLKERDNARSNWVAGISHDIRTPLAVIMGSTELLEHEAELTEGGAKAARAIKIQSEKIKKLIEDLNIISSIEYDMQPSRKQTIRICPILRKAAADICNGESFGLFGMKLELKSENAEISGDAALIERALFNLLNNCVVHNEQGCEITLKEYCRNEKVYIEIADNGKGIEKDILKNIDNMPKTGHKIGLPMTKKIVEAHRGKLTLDEGAGCRWIIELPKVKR